MSGIQQPIIVGRFGRAFGVKGWIRLLSFTDPANNILEYQPWYLKTHQGWQPLEISGVDFKGDTIIIKLPDCDDPETVRRYTNCEIAIDRSKLPKLSKGEYYWADLIGMKVVTTNGTELGVVDRLFETGANDVLAIEGKEEILLPYVAEVIKAVDKTTKTITVEWEI